MHEADERDGEPIVYVVDDDPSVRASLADLLASVGLRAATFASAQDFSDHDQPDAPSCLVLDIRMPGVSGLDFQDELRRSGCHIPIIFITGHGDVPMSVRAMKAGAVEFLIKPFREQELIDAIQQSLLRDRERRRETKAQAELCGRYATLSIGERAVMDRVVAGLLNKQIAAELSLSEITVKVRRGHVMKKMGAKSLADLVRFAERIHGPKPPPVGTR